MFSDTTVQCDIGEILKIYKEPLQDSPPLDVVIENYLVLVDQLRSDLNILKEELAYHKKLHGDITDSLEEFLTIQKLASIITQSLEYEQILENLDDLARKVIPHTKSQLFLKEERDFSPVNKPIDPDFKLLIENMQEEGIIDWLWEKNHPIAVPINDFVVFDRLQTRSGNMVISPMIQNNEPMGVYLMHTEKDQSQFSLRDLEMLNILTEQAAIAIQYTKLYKQMEHTHDALKNSQTRLMQTVKLATVGELAGGIAHEINNPLQVILGNVQMAMMGCKTDDSLKIIEAQSMRIANIVRGLLSMAKQNIYSSSDYLEINQLVRNTLNLVQGQIEKRGISIKLELAKELPVIKGSTIYFQQILLNFLLHAKKQIEKNGKITIRTLLANDKLIQIELHDTGMPLPAEYIEKIIDPFSESDNSAEMNLGLTVSVQMIRDIGGSIKIDSDEKKGNRIIMRFPKTNGNEEENVKKAVLSS